MRIFPTPRPIMPADTTALAPAAFAPRVRAPMARARALTLAAVAAAAAFLVAPATARAAGAKTAAAPPAAEDLVARLADSDPWGALDAELVGHARMTDANGKTRQVAFRTRARREGANARVLVRVVAPADLAGTGFLVIKRAGADDERWLYLPELKRSRRISPKLRASSFLGTDFSYADLDTKDLRTGKASLKGETTLGGFPCWQLEVLPAAGSPYGRVDVLVRKDNGVPLRWEMRAPSGVLLKTLVARKLKRVGERWFITEALMTNHGVRRTTEIVIESVTLRTDIPEDELSVRALEKI